MYRFILAILWVPIYEPAIAITQEGGGTASGDNATCKAPECTEMADMIKRQMGGKEPCDDFHNYVCGNWSGDRELKPRAVKRKAVETLIGLLENAAEPSSEAANATNKFILAYKSCTKKGNDTQALKTSIGKVMALYNLTNKGWPVIEEELHLKGENAYEDILRKTGPRPLFSYSVSTDEPRNSRPIILMTKPSEFYVFEVGDYNVDDPSGLGGEATEPTYDYGSLSAKEEEAYKTFILKTILLLNDSVRKEMAESVAASIVQMEKRLGNLATEAKELEAKKMNLSQLGRNLGATFPMTDILQKDFEDTYVTISNKTEVLVKYIDYYRNAVNFIKCSNMTTLVNYILWTHIRNMAKAEGTQLHRIYLEYKHNTSIYNLTNVPSTFEEEGITGTINLTLLCVRQLLQSDIMFAAGASYYIRAKFNENSKEDVLKMMKFVETRFRYFVTNNIWMTDATKKAAIEKLNQTEHIIGYRDWMLNDTIMDSLYRFVPFIPWNASFVLHFHFLVENEHKQTLLQLDPAAYFNKTDEDIPLRSHAYFDEARNTSVYPAAALVTHYRSPPIPRSVNYGTIGTILAQLLSKIIDRYGYMSKETGRYSKDTWDEETTKNFCNRSSCLNHTEECNDTSVPSTGKYEKLHDYLGVRIAFQALENSKKNYTPPFLLPDEKLFDTEENIFFTVFGSLYCPFSVHEDRVESRADDEDNFPKSLNEIVYNYEEFNKTFKCEAKGKDRCDLMPPKPSKPDRC